MSGPSYQTVASGLGYTQGWTSPANFDSEKFTMPPAPLFSGLFVAPASLTILQSLISSRNHKCPANNLISLQLISQYIFHGLQAMAEFYLSLAFHGVSCRAVWLGSLYGFASTSELLGCGHAPQHRALALCLPFKPLGIWFILVWFCLSFLFPLFSLKLLFF